MRSDSPLMKMERRIRLSWCWFLTYERENFSIDNGRGASYHRSCLSMCQRLSARCILVLRSVSDRECDGIGETMGTLKGFRKVSSADIRVSRMWANYRDKAKRRGLEWLLTKPQF